METAVNKATLLTEIMQLTPEERRELSHELNAAVEEDEDFALTPEQMAEINRRIEEHRRDPSSAIPWEEVRDRLRARFK
jgi:putative addiction module component (TIGR02574 family)